MWVCYNSANRTLTHKEGRKMPEHIVAGIALAIVLMDRLAKKAKREE